MLFEMVDESGAVLAKSVGSAGGLLKSHAPESSAELVAEHEHLVDVLRSPSHADDLKEADKQEAELAEYRREAVGDDMAKSHVKGYTRKDGAYVSEHDDSRQKKADDHPNVVGRISAHKVVGDGGRGEKDGNGDPTHHATTSIGFAGKEYHPTGKTGQSLHDKTPVHEFEGEEGHRVWADAAGRVHADSRDEVPRLRREHDAHSAQSGDKKADSSAAKPKAESPSGAPSGQGGDKPAADGAPAEGEVGHHEHTTYGVYHRPGSEVKDNFGKKHTVLEHRGPQVTMTDGTWFHPTKVHKQDGGKPMAKALFFVPAGGSALIPNGDG